MIETASKPKLAIKVRRGLYELCGVTHAGRDYPGADICGGQVFAERFRAYREEDEIIPGDGEVIPASWECFCKKCGDCDPNGWDTLKDCVREAPEYWCEGVSQGG